MRVDGPYNAGSGALAAAPARALPVVPQEPVVSLDPCTVTADARFDAHFTNLRQVFLYVTDECNLRCQQCYYKPWLTKGPGEMPFDVLTGLLEKFRERGAIKLSLLGGEASLYGRRTSNPSLGAVIEFAREIGFEYIRLVSNGLFRPSFLDEPGVRLLDELTLSIDGDTPEIHNALRGKNTFQRTVRNLDLAVARGMNVHITTCAHRGNIGRGADGELLLERAVHWAESIGARLINFHPVFKMDIARDAWTEETDIEPSQWTAAYRHLRTLIRQDAFTIPVRLPQRFVGQDEFDRDPGRFGFCPVKMAERIEVHPNGQIHSCALNNGTPIALARFKRTRGGVHIGWSDALNELTRFPFDASSDHPCAVMSRDFGPDVPLCISFKPDQDEFIWRRDGLR